MKDAALVLGAGGHAKVCIEILRAMGTQIDYCVGSESSADSCVGVPVLKGDENLSKLRGLGYAKAFVAVGSNRLRQRLAAGAIQAGLHLISAISPAAVISPLRPCSTEDRRIVIFMNGSATVTGTTAVETRTRPAPVKRSPVVVAALRPIL